MLRGRGQEAAHHRRGSRPPWPRPRPGGHPHRRRPRPGSRPRHGGRADGRRSRGWRALSAVATSPSSRVRACSRSVKPAGARQGRPGALRPQAAASPAWPPPTGGGGGSLLLRSAHLRGGVVQEQTARRPSAATATMDAGHDELSYHLRQEDIKKGEKNDAFYNQDALHPAIPDTSSLLIAAAIKCDLVISKFLLCNHYWTKHQSGAASNHVEGSPASHVGPSPPGPSPGSHAGASHPSQSP
ncbi:uncharacterized protein [Miscanthus floridulus]|uniref:uncharacterized protein n=1 Tax=Miscanthus floridulus TaxID=154761 RepID=UPI003458F749